MSQRTFGVVVAFTLPGMSQANGSQLELIDLLGLIEKGRKSGTLTVKWPGDRVKIVFDAGRIVYAKRKDGPAIGDYLVSLGLLKQNTVTQLMDTQKRHDNQMALGAISISSGLINSNHLARALKSQIVDVLVETLFWATHPITEIKFDHRDDLHLLLVNVPISDTATLLLEALGQLDCVRVQTTPQPDDVLVQASHLN